MSARRIRELALPWHSILPGESKVSALGLKFLGPAQRFTRSRGYRLSSQEVMPSSRREYQILLLLWRALHASTPIPRIPGYPGYSSPCRARRRYTYYVRANLSALKNPRKSHRVDFSRGIAPHRAAPCRARENRGLSHRP